MAFTMNANQTNSNDTSWKAQSFINLYLPSSDGTVKKLGAIPLHTSNQAEASLMAWLQKDPANIQKVLAQLTVDFKVVGENVKGFKLD